MIEVLCADDPFPSTPANVFWPGIGKPSNPRLCSMTGYATFHCIVLGSGRYSILELGNVAMS